MALALVLLTSTLIMGAWAVAGRRTASVVQIKESIAAREQEAGRVEASRRRLALAYAMALLESGQPPVPESETFYECRAEIAHDGVSQVYVLRFEVVDVAAGRWKVTARVWDGLDPPTLAWSTSFQAEAPPSEDPEPET
jgi:hypothetical protein